MKLANHDELNHWARAASRLWLFLDYDGTLAEFTETPADVRPKPEVMRALRAVASRPETRLVILSGRRLEDLQSLIRLKRIFLVGTYGVQIQTQEGNSISREDYREYRPFLEELKPGWEALIDGRRGFYLEDKGWTLALHALHTTDRDAEEVVGAARNQFKAKLSGWNFNLLEGHKFIEVAPAIANKGNAVLFLLQQFPWSRAQLIFCGDDDKDAEAFPVVHSLGGINVWVSQTGQGKIPPFTDYLMELPREMRGWLMEICSEEKKTGEFKGRK